MKKMFFVIMAAGLVFSASSCKKCGHCVKAGSGSYNSSCSSGGIAAAAGINEYKQAKADCSAQGGQWVVDK